MARDKLSVLARQGHHEYGKQLSLTELKTELLREFLERDLWRESPSDELRSRQSSDRKRCRQLAVL